jgi:hypothetical protein
LLGYSRYGESVSTLNAANQRVDFLDYVFEGISTQLMAEISHPYQDYFWGGRVRYQFSIYDSEVSDLTSGVAKSSVLAQLHDTSLGGFIHRRWNFKRFSLEPELELNVGYQFFSLNSLRDTTLNQTVLFGHTSLMINARITPRVYLPWNLVFEPELLVTLYQSTTEQPTDLLIPAQGTNPAEYMRTGSPKSQSFLLSYGASFLVPLEKIGLENSRLRVYGYLADQSKKFSGTGNRAGILTRGAETKTDILSAGLGYEQRF